MNITEPRYARYAWQPFTRANLVNSDGLPASTFVISVTETPDQEEGIDCGVAAPYVGIADGTIIRAGGANFPNNPMAPGSYKKYYTGIYAINPGPDGISTTLIGHLPQAMGYGCGVTTPQGLAVIAGNNGKETLRSAYMINVDDKGKAVVSALPDFPAEIDNMGACYADGKIYVVGGTVNGKSSNTLFALNLSDINAGWKRLKDFPGNPRLQPAIAATQVNGKTMIYMWGGFSLRSPNWEPTFDTDGLCYDPVKSRWTKLPSPTGPEGEEISVAGGTAVALPSGEIMVMGGVDKDIFLGALRNQAPDYLSHPVDWYRFNPYILLFNPQNGQWTVLDKTQDAARAGGIATLTPDASAVLLIGGEIKPRIRTANILSIPVK